MNKHKQYYIAENIPVADGVFETTSEYMGFEGGYFMIAFYDGLGDLVVPTAGTITPEMCPIEGQWHAPSSGADVIDATEVGFNPAVYSIPSFSGPALGGRATLSGVTGASTFTAFFWRK